MKQVLILLFHCIAFELSGSQPLSGLWKGNEERNVFLVHPMSTMLEIETSNDSIISGIAHYYYRNEKFEHIKISGKIQWKDSLLYIVEEEEIRQNLDTSCFLLCLGKLWLKLSKSKDNYILQGKWSDKVNDIFSCPTIKMLYEKVIGAGIEKIYRDNPSNDLKRTTDVQRIIELKKEQADSVKVDLYDNAEIDGDTISVYFNDHVLLKNIRLSGKPLSFLLPLEKNVPFQKIKMIAENLGSIPPNTALMVITTSQNKFYINLSSDFNKNAAIEFVIKD